MDRSATQDARPLRLPGRSLKKFGPRFCGVPLKEKTGGKARRSGKWVHGYPVGAGVPGRDVRRIGREMQLAIVRRVPFPP